MNAPQDHDPLAEALRREAAVETPAFSAALHARVMAAVHTQAKRRRWRFRALSLAAALAAAAALWTWHTFTRAPAHPPAVARAPQPALPTAVFESVRPLDRATDWEHQLWETRLAYLERDAQRLGRFFVDQVSVAPEPPGSATHAETREP
jgi:hypothetical protein